MPKAYTVKRAGNLGPSAKRQAANLNRLFAAKQISDEIRQSARMERWIADLLRRGAVISQTDYCPLIWTGLI